MASEEVDLETIAIKVTGDASQYNETLARAEKVTRETADSIRSALGGIGSVIVGVGSIISSTFGYVVGTVSGFFTSVMRGFNELEQLELQARRTGMGIGELRTAMNWSGAGVKSIPEILQNVSGRLVDMKAGGFIVSQQFKALASAAGEVKTATNFEEVINQLSSIEDPTKRATYAFIALGDKAGDVLDALSKKSGMVDSKKLMSNLGMGASQADMANVRATSQALRDLQAIADGVWNQILLGIAPVARALSELFDPKSVNIGWIKGAVTETAIAIGWIGVFALESFKNTQILWDGMRAGLKLVGAGFYELKAVALSSFSEMLAEIVAKNPVAMIGNMMGDASPLMKALLPSRETNLKAAKKMVEDSIGTTEAARAKAKEMVEAANKEFGDLGKKLVDTDTGKWWDKTVEKMREYTKEAGKAAETTALITPSIRAAVSEIQKLQGTVGISPAEQFRQSARMMKTLKGNEGHPTAAVIVSDKFKAQGVPELEQLGYFKMFQDLKSQMNIPFVPQAAGAAEYRTREAYSAEVAFRMGADQGDIQKQIKTLLEFSDKKQQTMIDIGNMIINYIRTGRAPIEIAGG